MFTFSGYKFGCLTDIRHNYSVKLPVSYVKIKCMPSYFYLHFGLSLLSPEPPYS